MDRKDLEAPEGRILVASPESGAPGPDPGRPGAEPGLQVLTTALARMMDAVPAELVLCTPAGSILYANHPARARLDAGEGRRSIGEEIRFLCVALHLQIAEESGYDEAEAVANAERRVMVDGGEVRLRAVDLGLPRQGRSPAILVLLDSHDPLSDQKLKQLGLTRAESQVARLVVRGKTNRDIAHALKVSIHTVRHHVQHIHDKVGVHSRTQLMQTLRMDTDRTVGQRPLAGG
ncbi:MAG TPA: helix-turn-helix transcriptional regulator [Longimicrobium sp.]|nr:helix-turn-helix transcriptional regulator [Longimicrobium sp.]